MSPVPYLKSMACHPRWRSIIKYCVLSSSDENLAHQTLWTEQEKKNHDIEIYNYSPCLLLSYFNILLRSVVPPCFGIFKTCTMRVHFLPCQCNLPHESWVGRQVSHGYIRMHVNTPPFPCCSRGPKSCWMMSNWEPWEMIKGRRSLKSPWWTQCPSNPRKCIWGDS